MSAPSTRYLAAQLATEKNDPPIEVNQIWVVRHQDQQVPFRKLRILAKHPDGGWIFADSRPSRQSIDLGVCPEFNLRYVFTLEGTHDAST